MRSYTVKQLIKTILLPAIAVLAGPAIMAQDEITFVDRVDDIKALPVIAKAFADIKAMDEKNIERLITLTEIPAPPFAEDVRALEMQQRLRVAGLDDVRIDAVGNVIARRPGELGGRTVAVVAHLDTVFPADMEIKVRREGERLYAPGIGDNTRALVVMLSLIEAMDAHDLKTRDDILFIGSVGEEGLGDLRGVRHLFDEAGTKIDSFIAIDGGEIDRVVVDAVGSNRYRVVFNGPGGHSYGAFGRAHPHQALADAISRFTERAGRITRRKGVKATFSVGRIGGGTSINSIPFSSWMEVDMRSVDPKKVAALDAALREAVDYALRKENARHRLGEPLTAEIQSVGARPAGISDHNTSLVKNTIAALNAIGVDANLAASSTDANIPIARGIPAVTISRGGRSANAHAPDEYWENVDPHLAIQAALLLISAEAGLVPATN